MRGIAWYNGGYGGYGLKRTAETDKVHQAVLDNADRLCFDYYVRPCVTLMPGSLWLSRRADGRWELTAAVSNIGGMDSGAIQVRLYIDGEPLDVQSMPKVPAGPNRLVNRVLVNQAVRPDPGLRKFEARIVSATGATVLDGSVSCERMIP